MRVFFQSAASAIVLLTLTTTAYPQSVGVSGGTVIVPSTPGRTAPSSSRSEVVSPEEDPGIKLAPNFWTNNGVQIPLPQSGPVVISPDILTQPTPDQTPTTGTATNAGKIPDAAKLPSSSTQRAIENLKTHKWRGSRGDNFRIVKESLQSVIVTAKDRVKGLVQELGSDTSAKSTVPFVVPDTLIIQLSPNITPSALDSLIKENDFKVVERFPNLGSIQVEADLSRFFQPKPGDLDKNQILLRGLTGAIDHFSADPRIAGATPDLLLRNNQTGSTSPAGVINNLLTPTSIVVSNGPTTERVDWGIRDIGADKLWGLSGADDGFIFGVMDTGFGRHEDLTFVNLPAATPALDHGNHVAGIACATHANSLGIRGVIPRCFVRAQTRVALIAQGSINDPGDIVVRFGQIMKTLEEFVAQSNEIKTFNVSLGYNWEANFGINIDDTTDPSVKLWRQVVQSQGERLMTSIQAAEDSGKVIFSAAGNDSTATGTPINAEFASPFNFAAINARRHNFARSGVVVEAHGSDGKRAVFSNVGGHISCPGVDIFSSLVYASANTPSTSAYGKMSGTSMAAPYCAAGYSLLSLVRKHRMPTDLLQCIEASPDRSSSGTPKMRLEDALQRCP